MKKKYEIKWVRMEDPSIPSLLESGYTQVRTTRIKNIPWILFRRPFRDW